MKRIFRLLGLVTLALLLTVGILLVANLVR